MKFVQAFGAAALLATAFGAAPAFATVDVKQTPTGFFVPSDSQKEDSPYYRGAGEDWSWQHSAIGGTITSASLSISAYDVDFDDGELNEIYALDGATWVLLGSLAGADDIWQFTNFNLSSNFFDDIATGLQVKMEIDQNDAGWFVTLSKSALSVPAGRRLPPASPGIPEPSSWAMLIAGFGLVGAVARRRRSVVAA